MPVTAPGIGETFACYTVDLPGGGKGFLIGNVFGPVDGPVLVQDADGSRLPVKVVLADQFGVNVPVADAALGAIRASVVDVTAAQLFISGAPFTLNTDTGVPAFFQTPKGNADIARMSEDGLLYTRSVPRGNIVQTSAPIRLTSTAETNIFPASGIIEGSYIDIRHITVSVNYITQQDPLIEIHLRDISGGTDVWTIAIPEKGGADIKFDVGRTQSTPGVNWTIRLSAAPPSSRAVIVNVEGERRTSEVVILGQGAVTTVGDTVVGPGTVAVAGQGAPTTLGDTVSSAGTVV